MPLPKCFADGRRRAGCATGRRRRGRCRFCRPVSAHSPAPRGLHGRGAGSGRRCRWHLVLEPLSRGPLRHPDDRLQLHLRSGAGERLAMVGEVRNSARDPALPGLRRRSLRPQARHPLRHQGADGDLGRGRSTLAAHDRQRQVRSPVATTSWRAAACPRPSRRKSTASAISRARSTSPAAGRMRASSLPASASRSSAPGRRASSRSRRSPSRRPI